MTTTKKLAIAVVALAIALVCVIGGTLAFPVATYNTVTNTFTYGEITLKLWEENKTNEDGMNFTDVVPGDVLAKDPVVTVVGGSEACYVYVLIDNQLGDAATYNINANWTAIGESGTKKLYRYTGVVDATGETKDLAVFTQLTFRSDLVKSDVDSLADKNVVISAYAHQFDNTDQATADTAAIAWAGVTASN